MTSSNLVSVELTVGGSVVSSGNPLPTSGSGGGGGGAVTVADGADTTLGSRADAAITTPTSTGTLMAFTKGLLSTISGLLQANLYIGGALATASNPVPVYDAYLAPVTASWTSATAANSTVSVNTAGYDGVMVSIVATGTVSGGHVTFEAYDGAAWLPIKGFPLESYSSFQGYTLATGLNNGLQFDLSGCAQFRARLDTAITGAGGIKVTLNASSAPVVPGVCVGLDPTQPLPAGGNTIGNALNLSTVSATWNITPSTSAYSAGMSFGGVQSFTVPSQGQIKNARLTISSGSYAGAVDLLLFSSVPGTYVDNAAVTLSTADQAKLIGVLHMSDSTALGGAATLAQAFNQSFAYSGTTTLWVLMIPRGSAFTCAASSTATLNFTVSQ